MKTAARTDEAPRWNRLSDYFLRGHGERVHKIPLDAGFSCPNRDGTLSRGGCVFCNPLGSGTGLGMTGGLSLAEQWQTRRSRLLARGVRRFIAYLQSFSNTYGPVAKLAAVLAEIKSLPDLVGVAVGTRPDCVDEEKIALIARETKSMAERWVEFGVQSASDATLARINRGHDIACAERAVAMAHRAGLKVCVHLIAGLPGESGADFAESVRWVSRQPVSGVKFHGLYVCRGTALAKAHAKGDYRPLGQEEYVAMLADALPLLRPDIVVQRMTGDAGSDELIAPGWAARSRETGNLILAEMTRRDVRQGQACAETGVYATGRE